jgi:hypothetical protein
VVEKKGETCKKNSGLNTGNFWNINRENHGVILAQCQCSLLHRGFCWVWLRLVLRYISLHFTWRILEHERSRWAKERRRKIARSQPELKPLRRREVLVYFTSVAVVRGNVKLHHHS